MVGNLRTPRILVDKATPAVEPCRAFRMRDGKDKQPVLVSLLNAIWVQALV